MSLPITELVHSGDSIGINHPVLFAFSGLIIVAMYIGPGIAALLGEAVRKAKTEHITPANVFHIHLRRQKKEKAA